MTLRTTTGIRAGLMGLVAMMLAACGESEAPQAQAAKNAVKPARVALVMKSLANEFFINMKEGAEQHQIENNDKYTLIVNGIRNESDLTAQVSLVEQMIASHVDAIVIAPADSKSLLPVVKRAQDQGIVVVNIDNRFDADILQQMNTTIPFVGPDNRAGARKIADVLAAQLSSGDQVAIIGGVPSAFNSQQRVAGFEDSMQAAGMNIVSTQAADWEQAKAAAVAAALLSENPELKAILCANDSMALGAVAAVRQAGRQGAVQVIGFDNISAANELVQSGELLATGEQYGSKLAVFGIEYALSAIAGEEIIGDRNTPVDVIVKAAE